MEIVAMVIVGGMLALLVGVFVWSGVRGFAGVRVRGPRRDLALLDLPHGLAPGVREPLALRAAFALTGRGDVVDVGQAWIGTFRGGELGLVDAHVKVAPGVEPQAHTIVTLDVDQRWPWTRLRHRDVLGVHVDVPEIVLQGDDLGPATATWVVEGYDPEVAHRMIRPELLVWLERLDRPVVVEFTPRHLLVAAVGRIPEADLHRLVEIAVGVVDHVPADLRHELATDVED